MKRNFEGGPVRVRLKWKVQQLKLLTRLVDVLGGVVERLE